MDWPLLISSGSLAISMAVGAVTICNYRELARLRRIDSPRPEIGMFGNNREHGCREVHLKIANDEKVLWEIVDVTINGSKTAMISKAVYEDGKDVAGNWNPDVVVSPGEWSRAVKIDPKRPQFFLKPTEGAIDVSIKLRAKADARETKEFSLTIPESRY